MIPPEYIRRYASTDAASGDHGRLHLLVLEGGQAFLARARAALERGDLQGFVADLGRTQDAVLEIAQALERGRDGDVARGLGRLYEFMVRHLAHANAEQSLALVDDVLRAYAPIVDAYRDVVTGGGRT